VTSFDELSEWNTRLKKDFPKRLVGELELSEDSFRQLLKVLRRFGETKPLYSPPALFPRLILAAMTFTARYDYDGAFWKAFCSNLQLDDVDHTAWGTAYRKALKSFGLFTPPEHWMINVFPVLFHSIVPEASLDDFAIMCRALCDAVDVRLLDDYELGSAIESADLPQTLRRFVAGTESREVALELVRHIAEDFRLGLEPSTDTLRGRILAVARAATEARTREYGVQVQPLPWRYDFNTGRCGVWLASSRQFEQQPFLLKIGQYQAEVRVQKAATGWILLPQLLSLPFSTEGADGTLESYSDVLIRVRVGRSPKRAPLIFRSIGDAGTYDSSESGPPGDYVVADTNSSQAVDAEGNTIDCVEELPTLLVSGVTSTRLFSLEEGSRILVNGRPIFVVQAATRPSVELRARSSWQLTDSRNAVRVVSAAPSLDVRSPQTGSEFVTFVGSNQKPVSKIAIDGRVSVRPQVENAVVCRASVWIDGRPSGASGCDFIVLPFTTTFSTMGGTQVMNLLGLGRLTVGARVVTLDEDHETAVPLTDLLLNDEATYEVEGKAFGLRYVGVRPVIWGFDRATLDTRLRSIRADEIDSRPFLLVTGNYGTPLSLSVDGKCFATTTIDSSGFAHLPLKDAVPLSLARGYIRIALSSADRKLDALEMFGVPQVRYENVAYRDGQIVGQFALDGAVESLTLHASPFHAPWLPEEALRCEGSGRTWNVDCRLPDQRYSLYLTAAVDGTPVTILSAGVPWTKDCGAVADRRSQLDVHLYDLLNGHDRDALTLNATQRIEVLRRCFVMLDADSRRREVPNIEVLFRCVTRSLRVADIDVIEQLLFPLRQDVATFASYCGLPTAAFRFISASENAHVAMASEDVISQQFINFDGAGRTLENEASLAPTVERMESFPDPLVCSYARLLRKLRTCRGEIRDNLSNLFEGRLIAEASLEVNRFADLDRWVSREPASPSFFALVIRRIWGLAVVSRNARRLKSSERIPAAVPIASSLINDDIVGELLRLALARVEADLVDSLAGASA
jgi:hypothetical protein